MKTPHATPPTQSPNRLTFLSRPLPPPPRLWGWLLITILLTATIWFLAPQQLPVTAYKLSLVTLAAVVGYWLDRSLFPYARPDKFEFEHITLFWASMLRRAIIIGCAMLAMGLGA